VDSFAKLIEIDLAFMTPFNVSIGGAQPNPKLIGYLLVSAVKFTIITNYIFRSKLDICWR
jgi:hypothetical protein